MELKSGDVIQFGVNVEGPTKGILTLGVLPILQLCV